MVKITNEDVARRLVEEAQKFFASTGQYPSPPTGQDVVDAYVDLREESGNPVCLRETAGFTLSDKRIFAILELVKPKGRPARKNPGGGWTGTSGDYTSLDGRFRIKAVQAMSYAMRRPKKIQIWYVFDMTRTDPRRIAGFSTPMDPYWDEVAIGKAPTLDQAKRIAEGT